MLQVVRWRDDPGLRPVAVAGPAFQSFQQVYDERFAARYGFWRPIVERA